MNNCCKNVLIEVEKQMVFRILSYKKINNSPAMIRARALELMLKDIKDEFTKSWQVDPI